MSQTMLATLALIVLATFTLSVNVRHMNSRRQAITREVEEMGASMAVETIEIIRSRAFDQAVLDGLNTTTPDNFTYNNGTDHFAGGLSCSVMGTGTDVCDDIDDFHKMTTATRAFMLGTDTVYFDIDVEVEYVNDQFVRSTTGRTFHKQVTVSVQDTWPGTTMEPFLHEPIKLKRVMSHKF